MQRTWRDRRSSRYHLNELTSCVVRWTFGYVLWTHLYVNYNYYISITCSEKYISNKNMLDVKKMLKA